MNKFLDFLNDNFSKINLNFNFKKKASLPKLQRLKTVMDKWAQTEEEYIMIDDKNYLNSPNKVYYSLIDDKYEEFKQKESDKLESTNEIINKFLNKLVPNCEDIFTLSLNLARQISKKTKVSKEIIEKYFNDLLQQGKGRSNSNIYRFTTLDLKLNICRIFGIVLSYAYSKMADFKIKSMKQLIEIRNKIINENIDIYNKFKEHCEKHRKDINKEKFSKFCKSNRSKYDCLPELIFLINRYSLITTVQIELNVFHDLSDVDIQLVELTILNIYCLLNSLNTIKLNIISSSFQEVLLKRFNIKFQEECRKIHESMKKNYSLYPSDLYENKWNFIDNFKLNDLREEINYIKNISHNKSVELKRSNLINAKTVVEVKKNTIFNDFANIFKINRTQTRKETSRHEEELNRQEIIQKYGYILEIIMISIYSLNNSENNFNLELIANDCYIGEFLLAFKKQYDMDWIENNFTQFHIFDLLLYNNIIKRIQKLNIEINTLDPFSFDKLLNFLSYNNTLTTINLSLFSSDVTYYTSFIYKLFGKLFNIKELKKDIDPSTYLFSDIKDIEEKMIDNFSDLYIYHISILFEIIKKKKELEELGFNFDIPLNIQKNKRYMNSIFKFILNILYFVTKSKIKKFCLLSPSTEVDCRKNPDINYLINKINVNRNIYLENLSLQMVFYKIDNIQNFISTRLKILNIGDLDLSTLKLLTDKLCSYDFNQISILESLSIGILNAFIDFNLEMKLIFERLFKLKIKNFVSLNIYTNFIIKDKYEYLYLLKILNYNWISEYKITFNKISQELINENRNEATKLVYLVSHNLEEKLLVDRDLMKLIKKKGQNSNFVQNVNKNPDKYDEAYWKLKYYFDKVFKDNLNNSERTKNMIFGILKYLYFIKTPKISHSYNSKI